MSDNEYIPISKPLIGEDEIKNAVNVLESGWLTEGVYTKKFEDLFADLTGVKYAIATDSGTSALHILVRYLNIDFEI